MKMMIVDVMNRKVDDIDIYLSYLVGHLCIVDIVDLEDPVVISTILGFNVSTKRLQM